jgi:hypothetical protein
MVSGWCPFRCPLCSSHADPSSERFSASRQFLTPSAYWYFRISKDLPLDWITWPLRCPAAAASIEVGLLRAVEAEQRKHACPGTVKSELLFSTERRLTAGFPRFARKSG